MKILLVRSFVLAAAILAGLGLLLFLVQRRLLYFPTRQEPSAARREALNLGLEPWTDPAGHLLGWRAPHRRQPAEATLLVLHGNAGSALDRTYYREAFQDPAMPVALDIVLLEYPGYGPREGAPTETSLVAAALQAIDLLKQESPRPILMLGESLGSAAAALAAAQRPQAVAGLLLFVPIKNVPAIAGRHYPLAPPFLIRDTFRADRALAGLRMPVAFLVAGRDEVVFTDLGRQLFEGYPGPKRLWVDEQAGHNGVDFAPRLGRWREMIDFVRFSKTR